ncbi:MAG TPA: stage II sporulation protein M, partial [Saprospiraceae bacterium]|nr:stage II sporulation protein M [Saprospiraceae bacterium]
PDYVAMTEENIRNGDPMGVYKREGPFGMTNYIAANNLQVAFFTALLGVAASIGTVFILLKNGVMVGVFQYFFVSKGLFWPSFLTIWIHGTLEISAIIIAGAAGLVAGSGLLFPGTHTRIQAFQISVRRGLKIFLGVVPVILLAAFFEGFLTRYTETPNAIRFLFILTSLAFVLWYFVWLPWHRARRGGSSALAADKELPPDRAQRIDFYSIKTSGEVLSDAFSILRRHPTTMLLGTVGTTAVFTCTAFLASEKPVAETFNYEDSWLGVLQGTEAFFSNDPVPFLLFFHIAVLGVLGVAVFRAVEQEMDTEKYPLFSMRQMLLRMPVLMLPALGVVFLNWQGGGGWAWMGAMFFSPFCAFWAAAIYFETPNPFLGILRTFSMYRWGIGLGLGLLTVNLSILMFTFLDFPIWKIVMEFFSWVMPSGTDSGRAFYAVFTTAVGAAIIYFLYMVAMLCGAMQYFSDRETHDADHLQEGIPQIGSSRRIRGLLRE